MSSKQVLSGKQVRAAFLDFFAKREHEVVRSSPLVPANDPTLLFTNAGMVQFKDVFTGVESRPYKRAASSQKCVRAGGKHNDLENVGFTARHHTFFEMLGNFSFGDYFKADAIRFAYDLLVKDLGLDPSRLMYTVFGGNDPKLPGVGADDEARELWKQVAGVGDDRVLGLGAKDNFWQMGDTGPMGPCSEIHYHQGDHLPCPEPVCKGVACECDRWLEIWNLVFMQYERKVKDGPLGKLPAPSVDTGAGLERVTAVIQGKLSNYETDLFTPLIAAAAALVPGGVRDGDEAATASLRVIADHARASAFLIADGVFPDKTGREYVLRRIFRRAVRHGQKLGIEDTFMHKICGVVIDEMGGDYPELVQRRKLIEQIALEEEHRFRKTLDRGLGLLEDEFARMDKAGEKVVPGDKVFQLYDTYGFPADLTGVIAAERGFGIDQPGFDAAMAAAQARSEFKTSDEAVDTIYKELAQELGPTEFVGYEFASAGAGEEAVATRGTQASGTVKALLVGGKRVTSASASGEPVAVITDRTPFYGASGGQIGDTGTITRGDARVTVEDTLKPTGDLIVHVGKLVSGSIAVGDTLELAVDAQRREAIRANHSATHLLHLALKQVLGEHAAQKGSLVAPDRLRFDYSHFSPLTDDEKRRIEDLVNDEIRRNQDSRTDVLGIEDAKKRGAVSMFGEKYGDRVRVVKIGGESLELCGGTHVRRAGDIGLFKIISESGIAQGVRRIEAVTGAGALDYLRKLENDLVRAASALKRGPNEVPAAVDKLVAELRAREKEVADLKTKVASGGARDLLADVQDIGGVKVLATKTEIADPKSLREVGDKLRERIGSGVVVVAGVGDGKVSILAIVTKDLTDRFHAGKIVGAVAEVVGGKGGGRPDMAQAGGTDPSRIDEALRKVGEVVRNVV
jgi:alanyl-tRNA synthetase